MPRTVTQLRDGDQLLADPGELLAAVVGHQHHVLDPDTSEPRKVNARLAADDVAGLERLGRLCPHGRRLVHLEPDPVAQSMAELLAPAGGHDHIARGCIDLATACAGRKGREPGELRLEADVVGASELVGSSPVAKVRVQSEA